MGDIQAMGAARAFIALALFAGGVVLVLLWGIAASPLLLAIAQDTGEGNDQVEAWPEPVFTDWAFDFLYVVDSFVVALLPGVVLARVLAIAEQPYWMAIPGSLFFLFPVVLLSMLEAGSPIVPVSASVVASLFSMAWAWVVFYVESAMLLAGFLAFSGVVSYFIGPWGVIPIAVVWVWVLIVYFRLIGRVAWCCNPAREEVEAEAKRRARSRVPPAAAPREAPPSPKKPSTRA